MRSIPLLLGQLVRILSIIMVVVLFSPVLLVFGRVSAILCFQSRTIAVSIVGGLRRAVFRVCRGIEWYQWMSRWVQDEL